MKISNPRTSLIALVLAGGLIVPSFAGQPGSGRGFGRLTGTVTDPQGNPLMGATVAVLGPVLSRSSGINLVVERVITDAQGRFLVEHLVPGLYSLRVTSWARVPTLRNSVGVKAGRTTQQSFALSDFLTPLHFQVPQGSASTWGDDWKWVLRTSSATRPVLRFHEATRSTSSANGSKPSLAASQRLIGLMPGGTRREALAGDPGLDSVLAYLRPLSNDSDLLVAGSMTASGLQASSLVTAFRKNLANGDPRVLSVVVHQLSFSDGLPLSPGEAKESLRRAQGIAVNYAHTHRLSSSLSFTAGFEVDYLNALRDAVTARPSLNLEYQPGASTLVALRFGSGRANNEGTLLDRIGVLNAFPRVTLRDYRPQLEYLNHAAVSVSRKIGKDSRVEVSGFRDSFQNTVVLGFGGPAALEKLAGNFLSDPVSGGVMLDAGNYQSSGIRTVYSRSLGNRMEASFAYALGSALTVTPARPSNDWPQSNVSGVLQVARSQSLAGKVSTLVPFSRTRIITSYEWLQPGRVTSVDPYGQAALQVQPFLGIQIRQPLPTLAFLPAHIEALADFRNLLAQGYMPMTRSGEKPLLLTSAYRSFRGGFSVQF